MEKAMTDSTSALHARARCAARRAGLIAKKSRQRTHVPNADNFGEFMLIDGHQNYIVAGSRFELTAEDVLAYCNGTDGE